MEDSYTKLSKFINAQIKKKKFLALCCKCLVGWSRLPPRLEVPLIVIMKIALLRVPKRRML